MYTEEEAGEKRCPFGKVRAGYDGNWDKGGCIASECMAWRWFDDLSDDGTRCNRKPSALFKRVPEPNPEMGRPLDERRGFCGLAGKP